MKVPIVFSFWLVFQLESVAQSFSDSRSAFSFQFGATDYFNNDKSYRGVLGGLSLRESAKFEYGHRILPFLHGYFGMTDNIVSIEEEENAKAYFLSTQKAENFFVTHNSVNGAYMEILNYHIGIGVPLSKGRFTIEPRLRFCASSVEVRHRHSMRLKEKGTNYWKEVEIQNDGGNTKLSLSPSLDISFHVFEGRVCSYGLVCSGALFRQNVSLSYRIKSTDWLGSISEDEISEDATLIGYNLLLGIYVEW